MPALKKHQRYTVSWIDILHDSGWANDATMKASLQATHKPIVNQLYYVGRDKDLYAFTTSIVDSAGDDPYFDTLIIPKGCITNITPV